MIVPTIFYVSCSGGKQQFRLLPSWKMLQEVFWSVFFSILTIAMLMCFGKVGEAVSRLFVGMTGGFFVSVHFLSEV